ncbi:hypothetical protein [Sporosarcina sp. BP05]|uniref:hypothetical protein n=1 Tax=Sporosarcina sp. BP05 TaxID=2758726 RepID=UPI0016455C5B|nr:hypothetical protein [Sporosarcina sp. BP05]
MDKELMDALKSILDAALQPIHLELKAIDQRFDGMDERFDSLVGELKEFRDETKTALQVIQIGQQGTRTEMTQRFNETNKGLDRLESDIEFTYQKTAMHDLKLNRIENNPNEN